MGPPTCTNGSEALRIARSWGNRGGTGLQAILRCDSGGGGRLPSETEGRQTMASIETRKGTKATTYRVVWVTGGQRGGARDSETCYTYTIARHFKARVEAAGEQRPAGYPKRCC